jgi:uncharacterized membrane protein
VAKRAVVFFVLLAWCGFLLAGRVWRSHQLTYAFLVWNLFLAVIPAVAGAFVLTARATAVRWTWAIVWLLFLPNAPYIVTDFVHLVPRPPIPLWYDVALLLSCAGTGLLLGYSSVADVQDAVTQRFGAAAGWLIAIAALLLSGFGVYLGRFLRWNSWDPIANPAELLNRLGGYGLNPLSHPRTVAVTFVYGVCFALGYAALHVIGTTTMRSR